MTKFTADDPAAVKQFVSEGYCIYRDVFKPELITECAALLFSNLTKLRKATAHEDVNGWSVAIMDHFERTKLYDELIHEPNVITLAKPFLGPDIAWFHHDGLFINVPKDADPTTLKPWHTDVWTGTSIDTLFFIVFFTDVDEYNGLSIWPKSHVQGLIPSRNRQIDWEGARLDIAGDDRLGECIVDNDTQRPVFQTKNLTEVRAGDVVMWHPLTTHATSGHSPKNTRISMTARLGSTERQLTTAERAVGYRSLSVGPLNQIRRMIGSDYLTPFRTLGGFAGIDRRMARLYPDTPFKDSPNYEELL